jgi:hypothetical protein
MPASRKQQVLKSSSEGSIRRTSSPARKSGKMAGTRVGSMDDWREGGAKGSGEKSKPGQRLRDGR